MRRVRARGLLAAVVTLAFAGTSATLVAAAGLGWSGKKDASAIQHLPKPGCTPMSAEDLARAGDLGAGKPPKRSQRQDCP